MGGIRETTEGGAVLEVGMRRGPGPEIEIGGLRGEDRYLDVHVVGRVRGIAYDVLQALEEGSVLDVEMPAA